MTTEQMREKIMYAYPGPNWPAKVKKMSDGQVYSVYQRLLHTNKIK